MERKIVQINKDKCIGCGLCKDACHEKAIDIIDNKAVLIKDDYCDGLGDCLPSCPTDAIKVIVREAKEYDEKAVLENIQSMPHITNNTSGKISNWPVELKLVAVNAKFLENSHILLAADCTAYAYSNFHKDFMNNRVVIIACPKLDNTIYTDKLVEIIRRNNIKSITLVRMEVPCCKGLELQLLNALKESGKDIHTSVRIISTKGELLECYTN